MNTVYFRTDGNCQIATGHLMRSLTIARACVQREAQAKFIVSDEESLTLLKERFAYDGEFDVYCLHRNYQELPSEIPTLLSCLSELPSSIADSFPVELFSGSCPKPWIFIDSYYASPSYFQSLKNYFRVAYLDDLRRFDCTVDLLVNYDTQEDCPYYAGAVHKLLGAPYTPLREQFYSPVYEVRPAARHVFISTGGTDPYGVSHALLTAIFDIENTTLPQDLKTPSWEQDHTLLRSLHYHVMTSSANTRYTDLAQLAKRYPSIHLYTNITDVAALMASCDLAVSAGGTTLCELCAVGVPAVSFLMAENQRTAIDSYAKLDLIPYAGDIRSAVPAETECISQTANASTLRHILSFLAHMTQDYDRRVTLSSSMRDFLDGRGAPQIASILTR